jgi:hypothetical protein
MRRVAILLLAVAAVGQTGCHGRARSFFYRLFHCDGCGSTPYYGSSYGSAPVYAGGSYGAPGCSTCSTPVTAMPVSHVPAAYPSYGTPAGPVFGPSTPLPAPQPQAAPGGGIPMPMGGTAIPAEKK